LRFVITSLKNRIFYPIPNNDFFLSATELPEPASPCGICRQFLIEFGNYRVILGSTTSNNVKKMQLKELLPLAFTPADLDEHSEMTKEK